MLRPDLAVSNLSNNIFKYVMCCERGASCTVIVPVSQISITFHSNKYDLILYCRYTGSLDNNSFVVFGKPCTFHRKHDERHRFLTRVSKSILFEEEKIHSVWCYNISSWSYTRCEIHGHRAQVTTKTSPSTIVFFYWDHEYLYTTLSHLIGYTHVFLFIVSVCFSLFVKTQLHAFTSYLLTHILQY